MGVVSASVCAELPGGGGGGPQKEKSSARRLAPKLTHRLASSTPARPSEPTAMSMAMGRCRARPGKRLSTLAHTDSGKVDLAGAAGGGRLMSVLWVEYRKIESLRALVTG